VKLTSRAFEADHQRPCADLFERRQHTPVEQRCPVENPIKAARRFLAAGKSSLVILGSGRVSTRVAIINAQLSEAFGAWTCTLLMEVVPVRESLADQVISASHSRRGKVIIPRV